MTTFGAFGYALVAGLQFSPLPAGLLALLPACGIEYFAVRPLWNLMFQFQGRPCSSLATLRFCEARAVTPFRNGRGLVEAELDGRICAALAPVWPTRRPPRRFAWEICCLSRR